MREKFLLAALAMFFLAACPAWPGAPGSYEAESLTNGELFTPGDGGDYFIYSPNDGAADGLLLLVTATDTLTIGPSGGPVELGRGTRFNASLILMEEGATGRLASVAGAAGGTVFFTEEIDFKDTGTFVVESGSAPGPDGANRVIIQKLNGTTTIRDSANRLCSGNRLVVRQGAAAEIRHQNYKSSTFTFELAGGSMSFADSLTMQAGAIEASAGDSVLAVGGGLTLSKSTAGQVYSVAPVLRARGGASLTLLKESDGEELADLTLGNQAQLDIQAGGVLNAGAVRFTQDHVLDPSQAGAVNAARLEFSSLTDAAGLAWHVGTAAFSGNYTVKGTGNSYASIAMSAGSVLASDDAADAAISLGTEKSPGEIIVDGGSVRAGAGHGFAIKNARLVLTAAAPGAVLDAGAGGLDLSSSSVLVSAGAADAITFDAAAGITLGEYEQTGGAVALSGPGRGFAVTGGAVIGGGTAPVKFTVSGDAADFRSGLALRGNGVLAAGQDGGTVTLGRDLLLSGGAGLDGGTKGLRLAGDGDGAAPELRVTGAGNTVRGMVSTGLALRVAADGMALGLDGAVLTAGSVTIERGGIYATAGGGTIRNSGGGAVFTVARDGALETTSAGLTIEGYDAVVLDGSYTAGWDGTGAAALTVDSDLILGPAAAINFTDELLANITPGPDAAIIVLSGDGNAIKTEGELSNASIFGSVGMAVSAGKLTVTSLENRITGDFSPEDIALAAGNMRDVWGAGQISSELAGLAYAAAVPAHADNGFPAAADAGGRNTRLLRGLANPSGSSAGRDTLEYMNGSAAAKVNLAGLAAAMAVNEQVSGRVRELRGALKPDADLASDGALPAAVVDGSAPGGVYFAGLRVWDRQDDGDGFSGYEYAAHGFLMGYDRAFADNIALGASFAYYRGDYMDGGALASASGVDGYALTAYGVYSPEDGIFVTAAAGYGRFDNDIRELRSDPSSPSGASWAGARYDSGVLTLAIDAGFDYNPAEYLTLTPSMGLLYLRSDADDHDAFLSGVATQRERDVSSEALLFPFRLAGRYETRFGPEGRLVLTASLGYTFNAVRGGPGGTVDYYGLAASAPAMGRAGPRHSFNAGFGVRFAYRCFDFGMDYSFAGGAGRAAHRLSGTVGATF